jgi:hypothetical protein
MNEIIVERITTVKTANALIIEHISQEFEIAHRIRMGGPLVDGHPIFHSDWCRTEYVTINLGQIDFCRFSIICMIRPTDNFFSYSPHVKQIGLRL